MSKTKKYKFKIPTWKEANSVDQVLRMDDKEATLTVRKKRVKDNEAIAKILTKNGWKFWDSCNIVDEGYSITFIKENDTIQKRNLYFSWHWDSQMCHEFYVGKMRIFFDYFVGDKYMHPGSLHEIYPITARFMKYLPEFEKNLIDGIKSQSEILV
jgi:hypothetical protein